MDQQLIEQYFNTHKNNEISTIAEALGLSYYIVSKSLDKYFKNKSAKCFAK